MIRNLPSMLALALSVCACSGGAQDEAPPPPPVDDPVASGTSGSYTVRLYSAGALQVGVNALALEVETAGGTPVTDAALSLLPLFTPGSGASHRCPVLGPEAAGGDGRYPLRAVFQVPGEGGTWTADVAVTRDGSTSAVPLSELAVVRGKDLAVTFESGGTGYVMALEFLAAPRVGVVPVAVTLHETADAGATFTAASDAALALVPDMPDMGHGGGEGGADPTLVRAGWYEGSVSFTMPGLWRVRVPASRAGESLGTPEFWVFF